MLEFNIWKSILCYIRSLHATHAYLFNLITKFNWKFHFVRSWWFLWHFFLFVSFFWCERLIAYANKTNCFGNDDGIAYKLYLYNKIHTFALRNKVEKNWIATVLFNKPSLTLTWHCIMRDINRFQSIVLIVNFGMIGVQHAAFVCSVILNFRLPECSLHSKNLKKKSTLIEGCTLTLRSLERLCVNFNEILIST